MKLKLNDPDGFVIRINKGFKSWLKEISKEYGEYVDDETGEYNFISKDDFYFQFCFFPDKEYGCKAKRIGQKIFKRLHKTNFIGCTFEVIK